MPMHAHSMPARASSAAVRRPTVGARPPLATRHSLDALPSERSSDRMALEIAVMLRHSSPSFDGSSASPSVSAKDVPESILMRTEVRVDGVVAREGHCAYALEVSTGFATHVLHKRYSEIRKFRAALLQTVGEKKTHCGHGPCAQLAQLAQIKFPRRQLRLPGMKSEAADLVVARARVPVLERFLQAMLRVYRMATRRQMRACTNSLCVVLGLIKRFLEVSEPVFVEQDEGPTTSNSDKVATNAKSAANLSSLPFSFPELAFSTQCGDKPASLFPIAEDAEPVRASE
jgi:hypothetical protein